MEPVPVIGRSGLTGLDQYWYQSSKIQTGSISGIGLYNLTWMKIFRIVECMSVDF
jgi:hypothetical protein